MNTETEMKFLVKPNWKSLLTRGSRIVKQYEIKQGYLAKSPEAVVRIRLRGSNEAFLTIKGPKIGLTSSEHEYDIPYSDGQELYCMCSGKLEKTRYVVEDESKQQWEVDVFAGLNEGLIVAEIELDDPNTSVTLPDWVTKDVTQDSRYANANLVSDKAPIS